MTTTLPEAEVSQARDRILAAAREEVIARGILGMRVAQVAARAGCSITSMYRYFGSRDGLLAEVLLALYEETFESQYATIRKHLGGTGPISVDDLIASTPMPHHEGSVREHALRNQVLAVAAVNPILRARLGEALRNRRRLLRAILADVSKRLPADVQLDEEFVSVLIFNVNWMFNDLMADDAVTNEEYSALLRRFIIKRKK